MKTEEKYPREFQEFLEQFKDEEACRKYLFDIRWPNGFLCPKCCDGNAKYWLTAQNVIHCSVCGHQASLTAGTLFHGTRKAFTIMVSYYVVGCRSENRSKCKQHDG